MNAPSADPSQYGAPTLKEVIAEFGRILDVLRTQLEDSVREAGRECTLLGEAFYRLAGTNGRIEQLAHADSREELLECCQEIRATLSTAVVGMQYQDRLAQRLGHVRSGLDRLQGSLRDDAQRSFAEWLRLLQDVESAQEIEQGRLAAVDVEPRGSVELF